ncbi:MAG: hypothetical protein ACOCXQ_02730 [Patescibacteria group bacterium]
MPDPSIVRNSVAAQSSGRIHVLFYQNNVRNAVNNAANAMLLHFDTSQSMGPNNFIDATNFPKIIDDIVDAALPPATLMRGAKGLAFGIQVFDVGIYTVVFANDAAMIPKALSMVPEHKRPKVNEELFNYYSRAFPGWKFALCCYKIDIAAKSQPLMVWYEPNEYGILRAPGLDEHTGREPVPGEEVDVDHVLFMSTHTMEAKGYGNEVYYSDQGKIPIGVMPLLPKFVVGKAYNGIMPNGDFAPDRRMVECGHMPNEQSMPRLYPPNN